ncbi:hypothetical protein AL542_17415 [Grimontia hollisae]|uniref:hypothetical protein n=1 Tax=Grimontia hollisae TaxID=673 RepID=UPI00058E9F29|nr:hypothetical protein [Grimontia hollisae]AMG31941.1 hypothetical protein AL542_17415 [Grimontia hollisae]STO44414.1 Uncharacterised protein [Grimontia hollisae]
MFFSDFKLTFNEECSRFLQDLYKSKKNILEYGAGGSTLLAAKHNCNVVTTETDHKWLIELLGAAKEQDLPGNIIPIWADVGATKIWGYPIDESNIKKWPEYSKKSWKFCSENSYIPDIIMIDGRFRVATFISSCINVTKETILIFDDYTDRKYYHHVENFFKPIDIVSNRMAIFNIYPGKVDAKYVINNIDFYFDPR